MYRMSIEERVKKGYFVRATTEEKFKRNCEIVERYLSGEKCYSIALDYGLERGAVNNIALNAIPLKKRARRR